MAVRVGQDRAIKRASDASRENERHSDLEFGNSNYNERDSSSRENPHADARGGVGNDSASRELPSGSGSIIKGQTTHSIDNGIVIPTSDNINVSSKSEQKIVFRRYPCTLWVAGTFIMICGMYLIYHLALGQHGTLFKGYREG